MKLRSPKYFVEGVKKKTTAQYAKNINVGDTIQLRLLTLGNGYLGNGLKTSTFVLYVNDLKTDTVIKQGLIGNLFQVFKLKDTDTY